MKINFPYNNDLLKLNSIFNTEGEDNLRIVGGAVRNFLLNKDVVDYDLSCIFSPEKVAQILKDNHIKYISVGIKFGTITAIINGKPYEITSAREDIQTDGRHATVKYTNDFKIDAARRDFTFNALYLDFDNNVYDYFNGLDDLKKGIVRFIGNADSRINEDYLRILRFFRFFCYYGTFLDNEGLKFSIIYKDKLKTLSGERIKSEMFKILSSDYPLQALKIMADNGILQLITDLNKFNFDKLEILYSFKKYLNIEINPTLVLSLILNNLEELKILKSNWKLSNKENDIISYLLKHNKDKNYNLTHIKRILFLDMDKNYVNNLILFNGIINNQNFNIINSNLDFIKTLKLPKLPIKGNDLEQNGFLNKNEYTKLINTAKEIFMESDYSLGKTEIVKKLQNHKYLD
ncbi:MAG TPA: CCA tRNA nucleotidyltransferase [Rickettsiales bacterium]|nr:CCA tRNA nucleotidyltransferase [Rickettsiales bacterium]